MTQISCEWCGAAVADPWEEAFNLAFIRHLRASTPCRELFEFGVGNLRNEVGVRLGARPLL